MFENRYAERGEWNPYGVGQPRPSEFKKTLSLALSNADGMTFASIKLSEHLGSAQESLQRNRG